MLIKAFYAEGFKNLTLPLEIREMQSLTVIHGANNVGKTNLIEAVGIFFSLLGIGYLPLIQEEEVSPTALEKFGYGPVSEWFNRDQRIPIRLRAVLQVEEEELEAQGIIRLFDSSTVQIKIECSVVGDKFFWRVHDFIFASGDNAAGHEASSQLRSFALFLSRKALVTLNNTVPQYHVVSSRQMDEKSSITRIKLSQKLLLQLYEASTSEDVLFQKRWTAFLRAAARFSDVIGTGDIVSIYQPRVQQATLLLHRGEQKSRIPIHLMGFGVQQILGILGELLVSGASVVVLDEPESSLAYGLHARFREVLQEILKDGLGPKQIFLTSHSPLFDTLGGKFLLLHTESDGIHADWLPSEKAIIATGHDIAEQLTKGQRAPRSYVTPDGVVQIPNFVRERLGVQHGGGVMFWENPQGKIEMLSDDDILKIWAQEPQV